jgi:hypothetical protein
MTESSLSKHQFALRRGEVIAASDPPGAQQCRFFVIGPANQPAAQEAPPSDPEMTDFPVDESLPVG